MRAVVLHEHGGPDHLVFESDYPDPKAGPGDVVVRVRACSLNYHDIFTRNGMPGIKLGLPVICGLDVAGEIAEIGPEVEGWSVGDRVLIDPRNRVEGGLQGETVDGGLAELCRTRAHQLVRIPDGVSFEQAAALPVAFATAHRMMYTIGAVSKDDRVLILGASGGVGAGCVLLAKMAGAEVVACTSSDEKANRLREMGADHIIDYTKDDFVKETWKLYDKPHRRGFEGGVNVLVNFTGGDTWAYTPSGAFSGAAGCSPAARPRASIPRPTCASSGPSSCRSAAPTAGSARTWTPCSAISATAGWRFPSTACCRSRRRGRRCA